MPYSLPLEILCHIFSFLQYQDLYLIRGVSRQWCSLAEEHIYLDVKVQQQPVTITIGQVPFTSTMELYADSYDAIEKVVEFKPKDGHAFVSSLRNNNATTPPCSAWQLYHHRQMQIKFGQQQSQPQCNSTTASWLQSLTPQEQQQVLFHLQYNPAMECLYALPAYSWLASSMTEQVDQHYVGDKSLILSFSYVPPPPPPQSPSTTATTTKATYTSDTHSTSLLSLPLSSPPLGAPQIKIHWLRVTLDWIISFTQPRIRCTQIYGDRYSRLYRSLAHKYGCYRYDELSEPVLAYIIEQGKDHQPSAMVSASKQRQATRMASVTDSILTTTTQDDSYNKDDDTLPQQLLSYIQEHTHEYHTRLSKLQHILEGACVDPRMIWKYPFAKSFVVGNGSLLSEEDVVRRIQDSEEEWRSLTRVLKRRFCCSF
ncbi:hypothetical protein BCR42DRAFT_415347 [Absidia repens]|uniref:F-box domain-containing protein n=1 Tax=Absidia repens TaxID=90262 RepID=A0A1X2IHD4_9FUNG|nr:hypothetical protein BCR42DRAFT_415347 [Absidia repens]